jgi:SAM-dependent methyltransferase
VNRSAARAAVSDTFGTALCEWQRGGTEPEVIERLDGYRDPGGGPEFYLAPFDKWPDCERHAMRFVRGRVLDVGCGAGRVSLHLQSRGFEVVGVDYSALALRAAKERGVRNLWRAHVDEISSRLEEFDTIVMFGNNFGIFGTPGALREGFSEWARTSAPGTRILAESTSPYGGGAPGIDRAHYRKNVRDGVMPGQVRLRTCYKDQVGEWFDWLFVSRSDMRKLLKGTGWQTSRIFGSIPSEPFVALLEKKDLTRGRKSAEPRRGAGPGRPPR